MRKLNTQSLKIFLSSARNYKKIKKYNTNKIIYILKYKCDEKNNSDNFKCNETIFIVVFIMFRNFFSRVRRLANPWTSLKIANSHCCTTKPMTKPLREYLRYYRTHICLLTPARTQSSVCVMKPCHNGGGTLWPAAILTAGERRSENQEETLILSESTAGRRLSSLLLPMSAQQVVLWRGCRFSASKIAAPRRAETPRRYNSCAPRSSRGAHKFIDLESRHLLTCVRSQFPPAAASRMTIPLIVRQLRIERENRKVLARSRSKRVPALRGFLSNARFPNRNREHRPSVPRRLLASPIGWSFVCKRRVTNGWWLATTPVHDSSHLPRGSQDCFWFLVREMINEFVIRFLIRRRAETIYPLIV